MLSRRCLLLSITITIVTIIIVFLLISNRNGEAPTDIALSNSSVAENAGLNAVIGTLSGTDPDAGQSATLIFSLPVGVHDNALFNIDGTSLRANASFDYEAKSSYTVTVRATDSGIPGLTYDEQFTITVTDVNEAPTEPEKDEEIIYAKIVQVLEGPLIGGGKTALITIDKGTQDGVSTNHIGWIRVHPAAVIECRVTEVMAATSTLHGWYYETIAVGQLVLVTEPGIDEDLVFQLIDNGDGNPPPSPTTDSTNTTKVLSAYYPVYANRDFSGMVAVVSQYRVLIPQTISEVLDTANIWAEDMWIGEATALWSSVELIDFSTLVRICLLMESVYYEIVGTNATPDIGVIIAQIAVNARNAGMRYEELNDYYAALYKLKKAAAVSQYVVFDVKNNPLEAVIYEDIARVYSKIGDYELSNYYQELADKLRAAQ